MMEQHLFGLVQCYTEMGLCEFRGHEFNVGFLMLIYSALFAGLIAFSIAIIHSIYHYWRNKK